MKTIALLVAPLLLTGALWGAHGAPVCQKDGAPVNAQSPRMDGILVQVDGEQVIFPDGKPQTMSGRTLVPMRAIFEALGAEVEWSKELRTITARRDQTFIEMTVGEKLVRKNGAEILLDVAPMIRNKSTLVPLRFVAEALDAKVDYDVASKTIRISTAKGDGGG